MLLLTLLASCLLSPAFGAETPKMAFVSMDTLFKEYYKTEGVNEVLKTRFAEVDSSRKEILEKAMALKSELEKMSADLRDKTISQEEKSKIQESAEGVVEKLRKTEAELMEFDGTTRKDFNENAKQSRQKLVSEIRSVVADYARSEGFSMVFDSSGKTLNDVESVIYLDSAFDITDSVLKILNKNAPASEQKSERPNEPAK